MGNRNNRCCGQVQPACGSPCGGFSAAPLALPAPMMGGCGSGFGQQLGGFGGYAPQPLGGYGQQPFGGYPQPSYGGCAGY